MALWITGARGFIGRHVAKQALGQGRVVIGLGHGAWQESSRSAWGVADWHNGEVAHANLDSLATAHGLPDGVVHLAGGSAVGPSYLQPTEDFRRTVTATNELAEWLRLRAPEVPLVMASSAAVYGAAHRQPIMEAATSQPFSPYGFHKRMAELTLESYAHNFGQNVAIVRLFSVYGVGLRKQLLWDACARMAAGATALQLGGRGDEVRDWLHVKDAANLLLTALDLASPAAPVFNGGTGLGTDIRSVALHLSACWGDHIPVSFSGRSRPGDPEYLVADVERAQALGWRPQFDWRQGMAEYVAWTREAGVEKFE